MKIKYSRQNLLRGAVIYVYGDTIAALILKDFMVTRFLGILLVGATLYAFEIPNYFTWIENQTRKYHGIASSLYKTGFAVLYFNPLWIARHLFFIKFFSGQYTAVSWDLLRIGTFSFLANIPVSLIANYFIQNRINANWRFFASALFSALMAIYYAMSEVLF